MRLALADSDERYVRRERKWHREAREREAWFDAVSGAGETLLTSSRRMPPQPQSKARRQK